MKPIRTCIVCRNKFEKEFLIKITKDKNGNITLNGKQGRGAYICKNQECHKKLIEKKVLNKTFKKEIPSDIYQQVLEGVNNVCKQGKD